MNNNSKYLIKSPGNNLGFTLIELLVTVAIIGILAGTSVVAYNGYISASKKTTTKSLMQTISLAESEWYADTGSYYVNSESATCDANTISIEELNTTLFDDEDVIIDQEPQFGIQLNGVNSFLQPNNLEVQYTVFSEFDTAWSYEVFIRQVVLPDGVNQFSDFDSETPPPTLGAGIPQGNLDAHPYFNINVVNIGTYGSVTITPKFSFPLGTLITCTLEVKAPDNQMYMETFYQVGFPLPPPSIFDLNQDGEINVLDVVKLWTEILNTESNNLDYDLNGDGILNIQDIVILINNILGESLDEEQQDEN